MPDAEDAIAGGMRDGQNRGLRLVCCDLNKLFGLEVTEEEEEE